MNRFLRWLVPAVLVAFGGARAHAAPAAPTTRPNVLFILTDDQRWDAVGFAKAFPIRTPNIDRIAAEGAIFTDYYGEQSCTAGRPRSSPARSRTAPA